MLVQNVFTKLFHTLSDPLVGALVESRANDPI